MYVKIVGHKRTDLIPLLIVREDNELIGDAFRNIVKVSVSPGLCFPIFRNIEIGVSHIIHDNADFHTGQFIQQILADFACSL